MQSLGLMHADIAKKLGFCNELFIELCSPKPMIGNGAAVTRG
jgi:hypothetical protein